MKNLILFFIASLSLLLGSCSSEMDEPIVSDGDLTSIEITIPSSDDLKTRAFSDGLTINNLKCYVYDKAKAVGSAPELVETIPMHNYSGRMGAYYSIALPKSQSYDLVLLATSCPQEGANEKITYNQIQRTINLNYDEIGPNDEGLDCFWGKIENVNPVTSTSYKVTLKRPFAQLNIGTKDLVTYNEMASSSLQSVAVSVKGVYTSMNAMNGNVSGMTNLTFPAVGVPSGQTFPVSGNDYLSMNYLLVNEKKNVDVTMTAKNQTKSFDCSFNSIPLQRNYRTNIYGNLLTASNDYKVEIEPRFDGQEDLEIDLDNYDLVCTLSDDFNRLADEAELSYQLHSYTSVIKINLKPYIDDNNVLKVTWEELGISEAYHVLLSKLHMTSLKKFNFDKLNVRSFRFLFLDCTRLIDIPDAVNWDTSKITDMGFMFGGCKSLTSLDISKWDTSNVTDMVGVFSLCESLTSLDLSGWDTSNVNSMSLMFTGCVDLASLNVSNWDTSNVTDMNAMFGQCTSLTSLDLSGWDTSNVTDMTDLFDHCQSLTNIDVSSFNTSNVTKFQRMFSGCTGLTGSFDIQNFDFSKCYNMMNMFDDCNISSLYWNVNLEKEQKGYSHNKDFLLKCPLLTNIYGSFQNYYIGSENQEISIEECTSLNHDAFLAILNGLGNCLYLTKLKIPNSHKDCCINSTIINSLREKKWQLVCDGVILN